MKKEQITVFGVDEEIAAKIAEASKEELKGYVARTDYEKLEKAKETDAANYTKEKNELKIDNAANMELMAAGAKNLKAAKALLDFTKVEISEDGTIKGLTEQLEPLKTAEDSSFMFGSKAELDIRGAEVGESGVEEPDDAETDISKMSYDELSAYFEKNPDAE